MDQIIKSSKKINKNFSKKFSDSLKKLLLDEEKNEIINQKEEE